RSGVGRPYTAARPRRGRCWSPRQHAHLERRAAARRHSGVGRPAGVAGAPGYAGSARAWLRPPGAARDDGTGLPHGPLLSVRGSGTGGGGASGSGVAGVAGYAFRAGRRAGGVGAMTRALLACGVLAGPLYMAIYLGQALTRPGFDITRHPASVLSNGDLGWIQVANFLVC